MYVNQIKQKIKNDIFFNASEMYFKADSVNSFYFCVISNYLIARFIQKNVVCNKMPVFRHQ